MKLKICGLTSHTDIDYVNQARVDYAGFVFASGHRQEISKNMALAFKKQLDPKIMAVGVFVDEPLSLILDIVNSGCIDAVQLHGKAEYPLPVPTLRGMVMRDKSDILATACDYVIFDGHWNGAVGSSGGSFDWRLIADYQDKPFFLAGGIHINNIYQAFTFKPYGIDISSGVEENGKKSLVKILEVSHACKNHSN